MNKQILDLVVKIMRAAFGKNRIDIIIKMNQYRIEIYIPNENTRIPIIVTLPSLNAIQQLTDCLAEINKLKGK